MKKLFLAVLLALAPIAVFAQTLDRDVLLTPDGTLYTIEAQNEQATGFRVLNLSTQQGDETKTIKVPEAITGVNLRPALGYDSASDTLFVFWLHMPPNSLSIDLYLASYQNEKWQPAVKIDSRPNEMYLRSHFQIGVTRHVSRLQKDGTYADSPALLVHAVWWEENWNSEEAHYALIAIENGSISSVDAHALSEFVDPSAVTDVATDFNREILRHPALLDATSSDSIDVVFGDTTTNSFHHVTLKPVADARIHIPIGHKDDHQFPGPKALSAGWSDRVSTIAGRDGGKIVFTNLTKDALSYISYADGKWSTVKKVAITDKLTAEGALAAVTKMVNAE